MFQIAAYQQRQFAGAYEQGWDFPSGSAVKNLPAKQEIQKTWVGSLGWGDLLKGMATHSSVLAWRIPRTEEPGGLQSLESQRVGHDRSDLACTHEQGPGWV